MWLSFLAEDQPWNTEAENLRHRSVFLKSSARLRDVILDARNRGVGSPPPLWLPRLVALWHATRCTVISLNYDTLVEKALTDLQEPGKRWAGAAYPIALPLIGSRTHTLYSPPNQDTFQLTKLHGSVNWCYSGFSHLLREQIYDLGIVFDGRSSRLVMS